ncbi:Preprotein translocase subunit SecG [Myxococcus hansupus]|uniref:Protein-export membrane protein SecG n=2 Tax=Pseudomyxococcus hansupus TaxID=1297742 RepID=A0A0H4X100_9BACT|nr:Preprotein translocase subunit SecG [Myxococcus hansupus]
MGSALGGGAATSAFGGRGAVTFLSKLTGVFAALFFFSSLGLSFVGLRSSVASGSVATPPAQTAPAAPAAPGSMEQPRGEQSTPPAEGGESPATQEPAPAQ